MAAKQDPPTPAVQQQPNRALQQVRVLEQKIAFLDKKTEVIENNIISANKKQNVELKALHAKVLAIEKDVSIMKKRMIELAADLKNFARREEVSTMQKYLDYWEPLNFVTHNELDEALQKDLNNGN